MNRTKKISPISKLAVLPKTYAGLCRILMPRTIHDRIELEAATEVIDRMAGHALNRDQEDYLSTLAELAAAYEAGQIREPARLTPHEFLAAHLENIGMSATAWGKRIGIDRSTASRLLRGERKLNTDHIRNTAQTLHIEPGLLI